MGKFIGLTGNFGCGKSTVAKMFEKLGAAVVDADVLNAEILQNDESIQKKLVGCFGKDILNPDRSIDKAKLAEKIFTSEKNRKKAESILHPAIRKLAMDKAKVYFKSGKETVLFEASLLIESGYYKKMDGLILVTCKQKIERERFNRNQQKQKLEKFYNQIIASQMPQQEKKKYTQWIIDNSENKTTTQKQVNNILKKLAGNSSS